MKPDAETIIAWFLAKRDHALCLERPQTHGDLLADGATLLYELREHGYSLIHGADHRFVKGE